MSTTQDERVPCKVEDFLDNDPPIRGQNYVCLSFISPEDVIIKKDVYFLNRFASLFSADVKDLFTNLMDKFKDDQPTVDMFKNLQDRYDYLFDVKKLQEEFEFYKAQNSDKLEAEYLEKNNFQTTVRGIKIRGAYETVAEAQRRAEHLKKQDGKFDVYVAEVGCWCPWAPNPIEIQDQEYAETELNTLMKKYRENLEEKEEFYKKRTEEMRKKAKEQPNQNTIIEEDEGEGSGSNGKADVESAKVTLVSEDDDPWLKNKAEQATVSTVSTASTSNAPDAPAPPPADAAEAVEETPAE